MGSSTPDIPRALTAGLDGSIYIAGQTDSSLDGQTSSGSTEAFVSKYNADGTRAWTRLLGSDAFEYARSLTTGPDGAIYLAGATYGNLDGQTNSGNGDAFLTKYVFTATPVSQPSNSSAAPICFLKGTQVRLTNGKARVESLLPNQDLASQDQPTSVKWIGYQRRTPEFAQFDDYLPVKICAGALEENVPVRDLYLSPDHAILVDGHLIHAKALVNGKSIVQMTEWQGDIEYYHIETENHEIIFAEGVPCETFIDNVSRQQFDNYAEYQALYPFSTVMKELPLPRVRHRRQLPSAIAARIDQRAQVLARQASS